MNILTSNPKLSFNKKDNNFSISGKDVKFASQYSIINEKTGKSKDFDLSHSTGSEWDPTTKWIYKTKCGITLIVSNDDVTKEQADNYLKSKLKN